MMIVVALVLTWVLSPALASAAEEPPSFATMITLEKSVHFNAPDAAVLAIDPGDYLVIAKDRTLQLSRLDRQPTLVITASSGTHDSASLVTPIALSFGEEDGEHADIHHIVFLMPGGQSLDAAGTYSGIMPRGLGDRLAERPLVRTAHGTP